MMPSLPKLIALVLVLWTVWKVFRIIERRREVSRSETDEFPDGKSSEHTSASAKKSCPWGQIWSVLALAFLGGCG